MDFHLGQSTLVGNSAISSTGQVCVRAAICFGVKSPRVLRILSIDPLKVEYYLEHSSAWAGDSDLFVPSQCALYLS